MRFVPCPPNRSRRLLASAAALTLVLAPALGATRTTVRNNAPPVPGSFVYCHRGAGPELEVFAGEPAEGGALRFGLTVWTSNGHNFGLWGVAARTGKGWEYRDNMDADEPDARCHVAITREADGSLRLASIEGAECGGMTYGGAGTGIRLLRFAPSAFVGPVTWQLDDGDTFFNRAGRCGEAKTS